MDYTMHPIGVIRSPFTDRRETPIQPSRSKSVGRVEVFPEFAEGLHDLEGFSHLILLYVFHHSEEYSLMVKPFLDDRLRGLFATRHPSRPNPIGLSVVSLLRADGTVLEIEGVDVLDGTPLLDIKPYIPEFDIRANVRAGWYDQRSVQGG
ncbi:MAG: tRNA (N6-threonylcarbamoyladenosine(37)-N6)-methyltransferase TrmO [Chloroflexi bacterium RBG_19FT_COMBO_62_14]|nr:MAG: tRNA (N6-threonylcarbamoyladenosine(37)-N6)-methyltransferase TrmO [Chloroflexi bacterium RBG_19FT_COMBO_62_14]